MTPTAGPGLRAWRVTTAVRAFTLALMTGQILSTGSVSGDALPLTALLVVATVACVMDFGVVGRATPWIPVAEGLMAAAVLGGELGATAPLLIYLAVPMVVAGIRIGSVSVVNAFIATSLALVAAWSGGRVMRLNVDLQPAIVTWLVIGLGAGLLASWQTRSVRVLEAAQAPYAAAHHLLSQLHALAKEGRVGLDTTRTAADLAAEIRGRTGAEHSLILLEGAQDELMPISAFGETAGFEAVAKGVRPGPPVSDGLTIALPLRVGDRPIGFIVLGRDSGWTPKALADVQTHADELALRLDSALLFDDVRSTATAEERSRLARDMHDGIAQEIVGLGYLVDEIEALADQPATRAAASAMRSEVTRLVSELRFSIFDLRHEVTDQNLSGALAEYVREVTAGSDLRLHLMFDEQGSRLSRRIESELMRVAQEAIANVRKHARARNLWITFETDGTAITLCVEDDGVGAASPRDRHYGLHTMRERAERIHADLTVTSREGGGTVVSLRSRPPAHLGDALTHEHHSPAGR